MRNVRGFTLLEVLVAIAIFALVSAMAFGGLNQVLDSRERIDSERVFWRGATLLFRNMEQDLMQARPRPVRGIDGGTLGAFVGQPVDSRALGLPSLEFTRGGLPVLNVIDRSDLQRVAYRLHERKLYRWVWPALDRSPNTKPLETVVMTDVDEFAVRFFDKDRIAHESWPPLGAAVPAAGDPVPLPRAVEVRIAFKGHGEFTRMFLVGGP